MNELRGLPRETEWVEFKENNFRPDDVGEYISALSNGAALNSQEKAYLVWGVRDGDHEIVGTTVDPDGKVGEEDLKVWLTRMLHPQVHFEFNVLSFEDKRLVVLEIDAAHAAPVRFRSMAWIRIASSKRKLLDYPERERRLWRAFEQTSFEEHIASRGVSPDDVIELLDYPSYFKLLERRNPANLRGILDELARNDIIRPASTSGEWDVTNLGAILFANQLSDFPTLGRKALRIVRYVGEDRIRTDKEQTGVRGYASGFHGAVTYLNDSLMSAERIGEAFREQDRPYPPLVIRELLGNALIHQDFSQLGNSPMVEIFDGRVEFTNPGRPLVEPDRFLDAPPKSRNIKLGAMMRHARICEERGTGWDKIAFEIEFHQLPAPLVQLPGGSTRVIVYGQKSFAEMDRNDRIRAAYLHACLQYVRSDALSNQSLRVRFGLNAGATAQVSRLIADAVEAGMLSVVDPNAGRRFKKYRPYWAADDLSL